MEKPLNPEESLQLISSMIRQAKGNVSHGSKYFLLWGWCIALAHLGTYFLTVYTDYPRPYIIWLITLPAVAVTIFMTIRDDHQIKTYSHLDRVIMWLWIALFAIILPVIAWGGKINYQINPVILLLTSFPTFITGIILRFKPLLVGGACLWIAALLCFSADREMQSLIGALAMIAGYIIPGYMLRKADV